MAQKSTQGKTGKYSNVVKSVKNSLPKEEPQITPEQVIAAFKSFGFEPNQRNHNDIGYWTTKGQSEGVKLMEELHKRRMDINKQEDESKKAEQDKQKVHQDILNKQNTDKVAMPRLSDEDINALFDEYGLPAPDPEWARNHLPNDPKKIRSILEMQRKTADDMLKKHAKNAVNIIPETPKMSAAPMGAPALQPSGMGGPLGMQGGITQDVPPVTPFFIGSHALVRITSPSNPNSGTLWLVDKNKKVLHPISSEKDLANIFEDPEAAMSSVTTLSSQALAPGGPLAGFTPLGQEKGIQQDGTIPKIDFSPAQLQNRYGKPEDQAGENKSLSILDGIFGNLNKPK
jgi:hypothetical protein